jgi:hypothetical protein
VICLRRFLIVLSLALLAMQGAFAYERMMPMPGDGAAMQRRGVTGDVSAPHVASSLPPHCETTAAAEPPCNHDRDHCACCTAACGVHCAVLLSAWRFEPPSLDATLPPPLAELRRDGLTHAPPLPPPIV